MLLKSSLIYKKIAKSEAANFYCLLSDITLLLRIWKAHGSNLGLLTRYSMGFHSFPQFLQVHLNSNIKLGHNRLLPRPLFSNSLKSNHLIIRTHSFISIQP